MGRVSSSITERDSVTVIGRNIIRVIGRVRVNIFCYGYRVSVRVTGSVSVNC